MSNTDAGSRQRDNFSGMHCEKRQWRGEGRGGEGRGGEGRGGEGRGGEGKGREGGGGGGEGEGGMTVIHILLGMFNSNPMIPQYLNNNLT